jgi:hypothetical protein
MCLGGLTAFQRAEPGRQADGRRCVCGTRESARRDKETQKHMNNGESVQRRLLCTSAQEQRAMGSGQWAMVVAFDHQLAGGLATTAPYSTVQCSAVQ